MKKRILLGLALGLALALTFLSSCAKKEMIKDEDMPGGLRDRSRTDAPKEIHSTTINLFEAEFYYVKGLEKGYDYCIFKMERQEDGASCQVMAYYHGINEVLNQSFDLPLSALDDLQSLALDHKLARYNGLDRMVNGLPEFQGARLRVLYESGERISANDNSTNFFDYRAADAIHDFFMAPAGETED